jgi:NitT/TauT family transport system substrate-binding protein
MSHAEKNYKSIKDIFQGNGTLAVQRGLPYYTYLEKKLGKPKAKVVPYPGGISHFLGDLNYSQQGFATSEPLLATRKGAKVTHFLVADEGFNPYVTVLVARKSFIEKNEELVKKVVSAVREGWRIYLDSPVKINDRVRQLNSSMDDQILKESAEAQKPFIETKETKKLGLGAMSYERWQTLATQLKEMGMIREIPEVSDLFRNL